LHQQNEQAKKQEEQARSDRHSITDILKQHEQRMNAQEEIYEMHINNDNILHAKAEGRNTILGWAATIFSSAALAVSMTAFSKFIDVEKAFYRITVLEKIAEAHTDKLYELEKMMLTESRFNAIQDDVGNLKKKHDDIARLKVIQASKVGKEIK
jgi:hypothetical protein